MFLDNEILFLGFDDPWSNIVANNKLQFQGYIYSYALPIWILLVYYYQRIKWNNIRRINYIIALLGTIILIHICNYLTYKYFDFSNWNLYFFPRFKNTFAPAISSLLVSLILTSIGIPIIERYLRTRKHKAHTHNNGL
jgi:hypothetical protein